MSSSAALLKWLCWALVVFVIATALLSIGINQNILVSPPDTSGTTDFVARLAAFSTFNQQVLPILLASNAAGLGVFLIATVLGAALRVYAAPGSARDVMAVVFVLGGVVGVIAQLMVVGLNQAAAASYCDCGYKNEELIGLFKALDVGFSVQNWLAIGALTIVGVAAALAGWLVNVSAAWRTLSYAIAIGLIVAAALQVINQGDLSTILSGFVAGVLVTIWAVMLALAVPRLSSEDATPSAS